MIPEAFIIEWSAQAPWQSNEQIEQDLILSRSLIEIYNDPYLNEDLAFRGGTAIHKLILPNAVRYSEDIDLVRRKPGPAKETIYRLQQQLSFLGKSKVERGKNNVTLKYRFESEIPPIVKPRIKIETNCREHKIAYEFVEQDYSVQSSWFKGSTKIITYIKEELLGTKVRALYQRKKGRDLFDLWFIIKNLGCEMEKILYAYEHYKKLSDVRISKKQYIKNIEHKLKDLDLRGDVTGLIKPDIQFDFDAAWVYLKNVLIDKMK